MAAEPTVEIDVPAELAELAVADDVDPGLGLLMHDVADSGGQHFPERVIRWPTQRVIFHGGGDVFRTLQTPDMSRDDAIIAGFHRFPRRFPVRQVAGRSPA